MPAFQNWSSTPAEQNYDYDAGVLTPAPFESAYLIKDVFNTGEAVGYSDTRLIYSMRYDGGTPVEWLTPDCYNNPLYPPLSGALPHYDESRQMLFTPEFQNLSSLAIGSYAFIHYFEIQGLLGGIWETISFFEFNTIVNVINPPVDPSPVFSFAPANLAFTHQQNTALPSKSISFTGNLWKIIGKPNFILTSLTSGVTIVTTGVGAAAYQSILGSGNAVVNAALSSFYDSENPFAPGDLAGTFEILENDVHFGNVNWTVVVARLSDFLTNPYTSGQKAFTLDTKFFNFQSASADTYFQFDATIKTYDFFTNVLHTNQINQKIVLFNGIQKINIGQLIHRLMRKFETPNDTLLQYKEAILKIVCTEKLQADDSIIRSGTSADISFIAGLSRGLTNLGFLDFNPEPNRVTKNSFAYLNILTPAGGYELRTYKNGTLVGDAVALPASTGIVFCKKVTFATFEKGDRIDFVIDVYLENNVSRPKKTFVVFPEGNYSNHIVWEDEFLLQKALECTGTASIVPEGEFQSQTIYVDLVERLEHLSSSKSVKLNINTGWLAYSDIDTIESLMRSKKAWLIQGNTFVNLRPIGKKLPEKDVENALIQFQLEFKINQTYNEETYSL